MPFVLKTVLALWLSFATAHADNLLNIDQQRYHELAKLLESSDLNQSELIEMLIGRADRSMHDQKLDEAIAHLALASLLGADIDERLQIFLEQPSDGPFVDHMQRFLSGKATLVAPLVEEVEAARLDIEPSNAFEAPPPSITFSDPQSDRFEVITPTRLLAAPRFASVDLALLDAGARVDVRARIGMWAQVVTESGRTGYVARRSLRTQGQVTTIDDEQLDQDDQLPPSAAPQEEFQDEEVQAATEPPQVIVPAPQPLPKPIAKTVSIEAIEANEPGSDVNENVIPQVYNAVVTTHDQQARLLTVTQDVWIRTAPNYEGERIGIFSAGEKARHLGDKFRWTEVETQTGIVGFVGSRWIKPINNSQTGEQEADR